MTKQVKLSLSIDQEVVKKAKELGFNLSKVCENCLKRHIQAIQNLTTQTNGGTAFLGEASFGKEGSAGPRGFEPRISGFAGQRLNPS